MREEVFVLHSELEEKHWWFEARRRILIPIIRHLMAGQIDDYVVDVGCGTGGMVGNIDEEFNCIGIDVSESAIEKARLNYPSSKFICGKIPEAFVGIEEKTGAYLLMDVLEHVQEDHQFLSDVVSRTRPGAHVVITVPARQILWSQHDVMTEHYRRYEYESFTNLWKNLPVEARLVTFFNSRLYPAIWTARMIGKIIGRTLGSNDTDLSMPPKLLNNLLLSIFSSEKDRIFNLLDAKMGRPFSVGVSLMAILRKQE